MQRIELIDKLEMDKVWDLVVIGGGASGLGIALDAVSRNMNVLLIDKQDFGGGTSSRSTKMIHGGVRYLEQGNFRLVREALKERKYLLDRAPHLVSKISFVVPFYSILRGIYYFLGLKLYDWLSFGKSIGRSKWISKASVLQAIPGINNRLLKGGITYYDAQFDDARMTIQLCKTIHQHGGTCINYMSLESIEKQGEIFICKTKDQITEKNYFVKSKYLVNASGIFTDEVQQLDTESPESIKLSRGSHLVISKKYLGKEVGIMIPRTIDGRVLFIIPWNDVVLVGTTDIPVDQPTREPQVSEDELNYLIHQTSRYLATPISKDDILSTYAGLRSLALSKRSDRNTKSISRSHKIITSTSGMLSIIGGKWTTFRKMGQDVIEHLIATNSLVYQKSNSINLKISLEIPPNGGKQMHPKLPYSEAYFTYIIKNEHCHTLEDVLTRRSRSIILNTKASTEIAPSVVKLMASILNKSKSWEVEQLEEYLKLASHYSLEPMNH